MANGLAITLGIGDRDRAWEDRAGWVWQWDTELKLWAGYNPLVEVEGCSRGRLEAHLEEHILNEYCGGRSYRPFLEVESVVA